MVICHKCEKVVKPIIIKEKRALHVNGVLTEVEIKISHCNECGNEVFNRDIEIENDNKILKKELE